MSSHLPQQLLLPRARGRCPRRERVLRFRIEVRDPELAAAIEAAVRSALDEATSEAGHSIPSAVVTHPRDVAAVPPGAIAVVRLTGANVRGLGRLVAELEERGAAGVQLVWDGEDPAPRQVERPIFRALERRRSGQGRPLILSATERVSWVLLREVRRALQSHPGQG